jgi:hypothetical protein
MPGRFPRLPPRKFVQNPGPLRLLQAPLRGPKATLQVTFGQAAGPVTAT